MTWKANKLVDGWIQSEVSRYHTDEKDGLLIIIPDNLDTMAGIASASEQIFVACDDAAFYADSEDKKTRIFSK